MPKKARSAAVRMIDRVVAGVVLGGLAALIPVVPGGPRTTAGTAVALGLAVAQAGSVLWIRRRPVPAMLVAVAAGIGLELLCPQLAWLGFVGVPLTYLARLRPPRVSLWFLAGLLALTPWKLVTGGWRDFLLTIVGTGLAWALGELGRSACVRREAEARRIVTEERARIARELHDMVAHNVSVIVVQAAAAEDVFDTQPRQAREALGAIQHAARAALAELRTLLQTMHPDEGTASAPQPGLEQLDTLVGSLRAAGLQVAVRREGADMPLPASVNLSAYRIVQESLTNTLRHAQATRAEVTLRYTPGEVSLEVTDDGTARPVGVTFAAAGAAFGASDPAGPLVGPTGRHGIVGMRERARLLGGTLDAGPMPQGGFRVRAHLPLPVAS